MVRHLEAGHRRRHDPRGGPDAPRPRRGRGRWATTPTSTAPAASRRAAAGAGRRSSARYVVCTRWRPTRIARPARPRTRREPPDAVCSHRRCNVASEVRCTWRATLVLRRPAAVGHRPELEVRPVADSTRSCPTSGSTEAKKIREEFAGQAAAPRPRVRMNQVITDVPVRRRPDQRPHGHLRRRDRDGPRPSREPGPHRHPRLRHGQGDPRRQNPQAGMQAFMAGKIKVQGDMTKLMAMQQGAPDPGRRRHRRQDQRDHRLTRPSAGVGNNSIPARSSRAPFVGPSSARRRSMRPIRAVHQTDAPPEARRPGRPRGSCRRRPPGRAAPAARSA